MLRSIVWPNSLAKAIDLNILMWIIGTCLPIQQHYSDHLLTLRLDNNSQRAMEPKLTKVEDSKLFSHLKWHAIEELRAQRVFAILVKILEK